MAGWNPEVIDKECLVGPVDGEAENEASQIQDRHGAREHHNDPDHGDENRETILILDVRADVHGLIIALEKLLGLFHVACATAIPASF